jgi:type IV pilus assembly protein PilX
MRIRRPIQLARPQRGAVLIVSLMLLLVMTLLGLGASQSTRMQERMAGNQRDVELAMQGAEAGLRASESMVSQMVNDTKVGPVNGCDTAATTPSPDCFAYRQLFFVGADQTTPLDLSKQTENWWSTYAKQYTDETGLFRAPQYVNEYYKEVPDTLSDPGYVTKVYRDFYRVTARSSGMSNTSNVVVETSHARIAFE